ncbi:MAG TPA: ORF6N domain-containing protein [Bacteroidales bacterium]|nr:ORF6N domain-containing protein [Bacteroidales bacterium]
MPDIQIIKKRIYEIRGLRVILDFHLADLYQVETRTLKQTVKRNMRRFPEDFMFELTREEWKEVITNCDNLPVKIKFSPALPFAFTEQGVAMLSSILHSDKAIEVNIMIMRAFVLLRQNLCEYKDLVERIQVLENEMDLKFHEIYQILTAMLHPPVSRKKIGFKRASEQSETNSDC